MWSGYRILRRTATTREEERQLVPVTDSTPDLYIEVSEQEERNVVYAHAAFVSVSPFDFRVDFARFNEPPSSDEAVATVVQRVYLSSVAAEILLVELEHAMQVYQERVLSPQIDDIMQDNHNDGEES